MWYDVSSKNLVIATPKHSTGPSAPRHQCRWPLRGTSGDFWDFSQNYNWWYWWYHDDIMIIFPKLSESILLVTLNLGVLTNDLHQWKRHPRTGQASTGQHRNPRISDLKWLMQFLKNFRSIHFFSKSDVKWDPSTIAAASTSAGGVRWSSLTCCELSSKQKALPQCAPAVRIFRMLRCYMVLHDDTWCTSIKNKNNLVITHAHHSSRSSRSSHVYSTGQGLHPLGSLLTMPYAAVWLQCGISSRSANFPWTYWIYW